jgi:hypothetical protein
VAVNSIADVINRQNNGQPIIIASPSTLHQSFQLGASAATLTIPNPAALVNSGDRYYNFSATARPFVIRAAGKVTGGQRYQIDIVRGTGLTPVIASTGLALNGNNFDNWFLRATCMWDPDSGDLRGFFTGWTGNQLVPLQPLSQNVLDIKLTDLVFNVALTIQNANPTAVFSLTDFSADWE